MASEAVLQLLVQMKDEASKGLSSLGDTLSSIGGLAGGVALAGIAAFGAAVVSGVGDAQEAARLLASTEQTITTMGNAAGRSAQQVVDLASSLSDASGKSLFGDDQVQQASNLLLTFGEIKGETFDLATALTVDLAQALGGAPADQAMMLGKALNDPIHGMSALGKAGLTFSEEQKAAITAMQESGDMAGAQAVIIAELNKQVGGQAAAAAAATGGWSEFSGRLGEAKETLGAAVLPLLNVLVGVLLDQVMPAIEQGAAVFGVLVAAAQEAIPPVVAMFTDLLGPALGENAAFFETTFAQISEIVSGVVGIVMALLGGLASFIQAHGTEIKLILSAAWEIIKNVVTAALALITGVVKTALALLRGDWQGAWDAIKTMSATFVQALLGVIKGGLDLIAGFFGTSIDKIIALWRNLGSQAMSLGRNIIDGIISGVNAAAGALFEAMVGIAKGAFDAAKAILGIDSPSKLFAEGVGQPIVQGIIVGVQGMLPSLDSVFTQVAAGLFAKFKKITDKERAIVEKVVADLEKQAASIGERINDAIASGFESEASIDRLLAANLDAIKDFTGKLGGQVRQQLDEALAAASRLADPEQAAAFYKLRSDQILQLADLQQQLNGDLAKEDRDRIEQQLALITAAQAAEQKAFAAEGAGQQSPQQQLIEQLQALLPQLPAVFDNPIVAQLTAMLQQLTSGAGGAFMTPAFGLANAGQASNRPDAPIIYNVTIAPSPGTTTQQAADIARQLGNLAKTRRAT